MANKVTTEWFDLHVKHGNYLPLEKQSTLSQIQLEQQAKHQQANQLPNIIKSYQTKEQLDELEDDLDMDDEFTKQYMAKRYLELKDKAQNYKYGKLIQISRNEYVKEVSQADPSSFVVLHLYQNHIQFCQLINTALVTIADKYPKIKFIKIIADKCIDKFPDSNCPCLIIYKASKLVSHLMQIDKLIKHDVNNLQNLLKQQLAIQIITKQQI